MIEAVEIGAVDGLVLRGELRTAGSNWVVLVHDLGEDLDAWRPLSHRLTRHGMSVLAFDLRGHGGSDGEVDPACTRQDLEAVLAFARQAGAKQIFLGAAGASVRDALRVGAAGRCAAAFALGPPRDALDDTPLLPKLAIAGAPDSETDRAGTSLPRSSGWTVVVHVPVTEPGCAMLKGFWALNVQDYVITFLAHSRIPTLPAYQVPRL